MISNRLQQVALWGLVVAPQRLWRGCFNKPLLNKTDEMLACNTM